MLIGKRTTPLVIIAAFMLIAGGCRKSRQTSSAIDMANQPTSPSLEDTTNIILTGMQAGAPAPTNVLTRAFAVRGIIREVPPGGKTLVVRHEDIPGFMPKMTMEFNVRNTNELKGLAAGDTIIFHVKATEEESWIEDIHRAGTNELIAPIPSGPSTASLLHISKLKPGDAIPDAELWSEENKPIRVSDFQGRALAFTFIFTRCPLPDFCPRMNQNFTRARELLFQQTNGPTNWQFLSISFDPEFDRPGVLTRYAYSYRGRNTDRWLFAAAPANVLSAMTPQLDFRFANEGGSFVHNLRTVVLDTKGRLFRQFDGNKWKPRDLADAMIEAARSDDLLTQQKVAKTD